MGIVVLSAAQARRVIRSLARAAEVAATGGCHDRDEACWVVVTPQDVRSATLHRLINNQTGGR